MKAARICVGKGNVHSKITGQTETNRRGYDLNTGISHLEPYSLIITLFDSPRQFYAEERVAVVNDVGEFSIKLM